MDLGQNIKALREQKGLLQKQVATEIGLGISHYNKIENGQREASVEMLDKLAKFYGVSIDQIVHPDNEVPTEVVVEDKTLIEQVRLINGLEEKDKNVIFAMLETMITKQKFKDFFNKNVAAL
ncbi:helix-turn-helix domain-containing protein [Chryseobacterium salviniae]|uniref:Helix-turn-helix transcriptional regulator n=1 Tax=Chryseobacterium salviniae TaxID=3101750 RepID=A0ABU6HZS0_9FLAO|nr:helix-turn-helix transcriptional regulator [Chryseobacterium sp. T9W2-O]MEC3877940.1 helix-turn-helix transcriptional regulator [Chryseobacterium sp. T9W2-O]MEC3877950.1 helix-turn-helix transcriptional regulator [Chryseobacterium sp. T9W2-O]MEC3877962.1 helix-turn-helix transcriptional regulator [Chryseobacterium sp. T9W2-O]